MIYNFGEQLKELRKSLTLTQAQFANKLGTTRQAVSLWEINYSQPTIEMFRKICVTFGLSADEILEL